MPATMWKPEFDEFIKQNNRLTTAQIARELGASERNVRRYRARLKAKLPGYRRPKSACNSQRSVEWRPPGWTIECGHPCPFCKYYPPEPTRETIPCSNSSARIEWLTQYL